jgi:hypothetical protein
MAGGLVRIRLQFGVVSVRPERRHRGRRGVSAQHVDVIMPKGDSLLRPRALRRGLPSSAHRRFATSYALQVSCKHLALYSPLSCVPAARLRVTIL